VRRQVAVALVVALLASACGAVADTASGIVAFELPDIEAVPIEPPEQTLVYDGAGNQLAVLRTEFRQRAELDEMPEHLLDAVVVAEDRRFWLHGGLDARGIVRAALTNVAAGEVEQGGSTITQQLVKNLYMPTAERTPQNKLREAILTRQVEEQRSKPEILEDYLNTVYFGNGAYGVQAAAQTYFRKDVGALGLGEAALLAAIIRSPESLNPERNTEAARVGRDVVLDAMLEQELIDERTAEQAKGRPIVVAARPPTPDTVEPRWVDYVVRYLLDEQSFGADEADRAQRLFGGGLRVHTTLQPALQAQAVATVQQFLPDAEDPEVAIASVVPQTGEVVALVGGRDYADSQFDLATQALRQPGSTFKTFVLATAVTSGWDPDDRISGNQGVFQTPEGIRWTVRNYARVSYGMITLREAVRASVNGAFARLILDLGVGRVVAMANAMGVRSALEERAPIALGSEEVTPLDMAAAYATLANLGEHVPTTPIDRIESADGRIVWQPDDRARRALDPSAAFVVTDMLRTAVEAGTGTAARIPGWEVAGKTGTVQDYKDAWFVGYTPVLATAVWVGYRDVPRPLRNIRGVRQVTGGSIPARIWQAFVSAALQGVEPVSFSLPDQFYEVVEIDPVTGLRAAPWCPGEVEAMPRILVPRETCPSPQPAPPPPPSPPGRQPQPADCPSDPENGSPAPAPTSRPEGCPEPTEPVPGPGGADPSPEPEPEPEPEAEAEAQ